MKIILKNSTNAIVRLVEEATCDFCLQPNQKTLRADRRDALDRETRKPEEGDVDICKSCVSQLSALFDDMELIPDQISPGEMEDEDSRPF